MRKAKSRPGTPVKKKAVRQLSPEKNPAMRKPTAAPSSAPTLQRERTLARRAGGYCAGSIGVPAGEELPSPRPGTAGTPGRGAELGTSPGETVARLHTATPAPTIPLRLRRSARKPSGKATTV